jgi:hypothetical protein
LLGQRARRAADGKDSVVHFDHSDVSGDSSF